MGKMDSGNSARDPLRSIVAGGITGGVEILITFPTEYVKTQLQLDEKSATPKYAGPVDCVKKTIKTHGFFGMYRGLSSLLYGSVPKVGIRFSVFEKMKGFYQDGTNRALTRKETLIAGLTAGVTEAIFVVTPMETIKVRFISDQTSPNPRYRGFFSGVVDMVKTDGVSQLFRGLTPTILKQGSNQAIRFVAMAELTNLITGGDRKPNVLETLLCGAGAGALSVFGNTPIDVVKTRMQGGESHKYTGTIDCIQKIWKNEGFSAFYKGTTPRLSRVCCEVALAFALYEQINNAIDYVWPRKQ